MKAMGISIVVAAALSFAACEDKAKEGEAAKVPAADEAAKPAGREKPDEVAKPAEGEKAPAEAPKVEEKPAEEAKPAETAPPAAAPDAGGAPAAPSPAEGQPADAAAAAAAAAEAPKERNPDLLDPSKATETAPATFAVKFETTAGEFVVDVTREWAPLGADRFWNLVKLGFYDDTFFFRVIGGFMVQFGLSGDPNVNTAWRDARIDDDPVKQSNTRGMVTFAMAGPNTRTTQLFVNFGDNSRLDGMKFAPFGKVREPGMDVVDKIYSGYGEGAPMGRGPNQAILGARGNEYLKAEFPKLDRIVRATLLEGETK